MIWNRPISASPFEASGSLSIVATGRIAPVALLRRSGSRYTANPAASGTTPTMPATIAVNRLYKMLRRAVSGNGPWPGVPSGTCATGVRDRVEGVRGARGISSIVLFLGGRRDGNYEAGDEL